MTTTTHNQYYDDAQFINTCKTMDLEDVKKQLSKYPNINIHAENEAAFCIACYNGRLEIVKYLIELHNLDSKRYTRINIHANDDYAFIMACANGHLKLAKYLMELPIDVYGKINIHAENEYAFRCACIIGRLDVIKYLTSLPVEVYGKIDIRICNDEAVRKACKFGKAEIVKYLCEICENYSYSVVSETAIMLHIKEKINIDKLQIIEVKEEEKDKVKCIICNEIIDIINLNCISSQTVNKTDQTNQSVDIDANADLFSIQSVTDLLKIKSSADLSKIISNTVDISKIMSTNPEKKQSTNNNAHMHCYCLSCLNEIYTNTKKCSYCMQPIDENRLQRIKIIPSN